MQTEKFRADFEIKMSAKETDDKRFQFFLKTIVRKTESKLDILLFAVSINIAPKNSPSKPI